MAIPVQAPCDFRHVIGMRVDATSYDHGARQTVAWAEAGTRGYVCAANVHMTMECHDSREFQQVVNNSLLVTPDGQPLVWMLRLLKVKDPTGARQKQVYGPTLMLHILRVAAAENVPIGLYGGTEEAIAGLMKKISADHPSLQIAYTCSPPFRKITPEEDAAEVARINASGAKILFVGLGCPKQEKWMAAHREGINPVMVGVGAAFAFHAGQVKQAPEWMRARGLEWMFRLYQEPRRLWYRYCYHNPRFIFFSTLQLLHLRSGKPKA
jgi:N-acetylglucosaminyldiphosphoundecaprenol N-acetyl-beta-D-mannosaminyltransferase